MQTADHKFNVQDAILKNVLNVLNPAAPKSDLRNVKILWQTRWNYECR